MGKHINFTKFDNPDIKYCLKYIELIKKITSEIMKRGNFSTFQNINFLRSLLGTKNIVYLKQK